MFATIYSIPLGTTITQQWATNTNSTAQKIINFIQVGVLLINYNIVLSLAERRKKEKILVYISQEEMVNIDIFSTMNQSQFS